MLTLSNLNARLAAMADAHYAAFSSGLIPELARPMLGVRLPDLRRYARELARRASDVDALLALIATGTAHEHRLLAGMVIGYAPAPWAVWRQRVERFVPLIDNWAVCDTVCTSLTLIRSHLSEGWPWLTAFLRSPQPYGRRFALVMLLNHYATPEWAPRIMSLLPALGPQPRCVTMAAGWLLQRLFTVTPHAVMAALSAPAIDRDIRLTARRKLLESRQTPADLRTDIKALKL